MKITSTNATDLKKLLLMAELKDVSTNKLIDMIIHNEIPEDELSFLEATALAKLEADDISVRFKPSQNSMLIKT